MSPSLQLDALNPKPSHTVCQCLQAELTHSPVGLTLVHALFSWADTDGRQPLSLLNAQNTAVDPYNLGSAHVLDLLEW